MVPRQEPIINRTTMTKPKHTQSPKNDVRPIQRSPVPAKYNVTEHLDLLAPIHIQQDEEGRESNDYNQVHELESQQHPNSPPKLPVHPTSTKPSQSGTLGVPTADSQSTQIPETLGSTSSPMKTRSCKLLPSLSPTPPHQDRKRKRSPPIDDRTAGPDVKRSKLKPSATEPAIGSSSQTGGASSTPAPVQIPRKPLTATRTEPIIGTSKAVRATLPTFIWNQETPDMRRQWISEPDELTSALARLLQGVDTVAFDMEWRYDGEREPWLREGRTALIQISSPTSVIIYGLPMDPASPLHPSIVELLRSNVIKVGNNIAGDVDKLYSDFPSLPDFNSFIDLTYLALTVDGRSWPGKKRLGLGAMMEKYLEFELPGKDTTRVSDWELRGDMMTTEQLDYASADVTASLQLYNKLRRIQAQNDPLRRLDLSGVVFKTGQRDREFAKSRRPRGNYGRWLKNNSKYESQLGY